MDRISTIAPGSTIDAVIESDEYKNIIPALHAYAMASVPENCPNNCTRCIQAGDGAITRCDIQRSAYAVMYCPTRKTIKPTAPIQRLPLPAIGVAGRNAPMSRASLYASGLPVRHAMTLVGTHSANNTVM